MPLTDVQIRNLNGGQQPVKPSNEKLGPPKVSKPKNTTKGIGATLAKTDDEPEFIARKGFALGGISMSLAVLVLCLVHWIPSPASFS
jgi:hypothetical protein